MNTLHMRLRPWGSRGFSLIELLVSLAIGLVIMTATLSVYVSASSSTRFTDMQARMNEDGQAALAILTREIRMAGNNPKIEGGIDDANNPANSSLRHPVYKPAFDVDYYTYTGYTKGLDPLYGQAINACDGGFTATSLGNNSPLDNLACNTGSTATSADAIAVSYEADRYNTTPTSTGNPTDCLGNSLAARTETMRLFDSATSSETTRNDVYRVADNRYYIATSTDINAPSLYCRSRGGTAQPLVQNIENLQLEFGTLKPGSGSTDIAGYLSASEIKTAAAMAALNNDAERWMQVATVRVCVLVRSEDPVAPDAAAAKYYDCNGNLQTAPDLRLRKAFFATVVMPNQIFH